MDACRGGKFAAWSPASWARPVLSWLRLHLRLGESGVGSDFQHGAVCAGEELGWPQACIRPHPWFLHFPGQSQGRDLGLRQAGRGREGREGRSEVTLSGEPDRGREGTLVRDSSRRAVKAKERPVWKLRVGGHLAYLRKRAAWVPRRCSSGRVVTPDNKPEAQPCWPVWRVLSRKGDVSVYLGCETLNLLITYLCTLHQSIHPFLVHCSVSPFSSAWRADCVFCTHSLPCPSLSFNSVAHLMFVFLRFYSLVIFPRTILCWWFSLTVVP